MLVVSTASPYKFAYDCFLAVNGKAASDELSALSELEALSGVKIPTPLSSLAGKPVIHTQVIEKELMEDTVLAFAKNQ